MLPRALKILLAAQRLPIGDRHRQQTTGSFGIAQRHTPELILDVDDAATHRNFTS